MRRNISLYIDGKLVDTDGQSFVLFNYTRDEASNPTIVKNSYSQSATLPGTPNNDEIFEQSFRLDRITTSGHFNPLTQTPFVIYDELGQILERGYCKLSNIDKKGNSHTYSISLFGGLGSFFYNLTYKADGSKKTLADVIVESEWHQEEYDSLSTHIYNVNRTAIKSRWDHLASGVFTDLIQFVPTADGFPEGEFDSNKAFVKVTSGAVGRVPGINPSRDGYGPRSGVSNAVLVEMANKHTGWECQDLRDKWQRPALNVWQYLQILKDSHNTGDFTLVLDTDFFSINNPRLAKLYMTLPITPDATTYGDAMADTCTPAEFLIGLAKVFGLVFDIDQATNTITLIDREAYYASGSDIDFSSRVDTSHKIVPQTMKSKRYTYAYPTVYGEQAAAYERQYGKKFGAKVVNTGYDFADENKNVYDSLPFNGAVNVRESNTAFSYFPSDSGDQYGDYVNYAFKFACLESCKYKLYKYTNSKESSQDFEPEAAFHISERYDGNSWAANNNFYDFMTRVQLHAAGQKAEKGLGVFVNFIGMVSTPGSRHHPTMEAEFHLSSTCPEMLTLNDGKPCWDMSPAHVNSSYSTAVYELPQFLTIAKSGSYYYGMEFGQPAKEYYPETYSRSYIYPDYWQDYIGDKFSVDSKVVTVKVDFSGMQVDASLLKNFYYFADGWWVLNKINNYSMTTHDLTECEFIKVQDKENYYSI